MERDDNRRRRSPGPPNGRANGRPTGRPPRRGDGQGAGRPGRPSRSGRSGGGRSARPGPGKQPREGGFGPFGRPEPRERERRPDEPERERRPPARYRIKGEPRRRDETPAKPRRPTRTTGGPHRRRKPKAPADVQSEIRRLGGKRAPHLLEDLMAAADAFGHDRDRETTTLLRPLRDVLPDSPSVRELLGLAQYRLGNYRAASKELEIFVDLTDSVEQHPVLMDSLRAQRRWKRVDELWGELAAASPSGELVTEGRIVVAGSLADRGDLDAAIALLGRKAGDVRHAKPHHLRLWYALGDLEERAGNLARARSLFARVHGHDREFADVATRLRGVG